MSDMAKVTLAELQGRKQAGQKITMLTAYDYPFGKLIDASGVDIILVGDSLGMVVLGYETTAPVTMEEMLHHARAARRSGPLPRLLCHASQSRPRPPRSAV